jgi:hypothetical protein
MHKLTYVSIAAALAAVAAAAGAQTDPVGASKIQPVVPPQLVPPQAVPAQPALPAPPAFQPPVITVEWNKADAKELLTYIERVNEEGLDPADYAPAKLRAAIDGSDNAQLSAVATETFLRLSSDLAMPGSTGTSTIPISTGTSNMR